jgi:ribosomal peptide maturation radical SAM protein 1
MNEAINLRAYETISELLLFGEWVFAQHLFGESGTGELKDSALTERDIETVKITLENMKIDFARINEEVMPKFIDECLSIAPWEKYDVVGFTSVFSQNVACLFLAYKLKQLYPHLKTVIGGANVQSVMGRATAEAFEWIDYVVDGEGEELFPQLVENILDGKPYEKVPGILFRENGQVAANQGLPPMVRLDDTPVPDYTEYFSQLKDSGLKTLVDPSLLIESSRGCWWGEKAHCTFCGLNGQSMKYRTKSPEKVITEVIEQSSKYQTLIIEAVDNIIDRGAFENLIPQLAQHKLDLDMFYEVKSSLSREQIELLIAAGVTRIQPGIESLHTEILKLMRKGVTGIQNIQLLKWCKVYDLKVVWNLLCGFPGETSQHYQQMVETMSFITHLQPPSSAPRIILQRFSPYFFDSERLGIRNVRPMSLYNKIYPKERVNLMDIAYYFDYSLDDSYEDPDSYLGPVRDAMKRWAVGYYKGKYYFRYRKGPGFIELKDSRPKSLAGDGKLIKRAILTGDKMLAFEFCESIKGFREISEHIGRHSDVPPSEEQVQLTLDELVEKKYLFREGARYLSLATPSRRSDL